MFHLFDRLFSRPTGGLGWVLTPTHLIRPDAVVDIDTNLLEELKVSVKLTSGEVIKVEGIQAIEIVMTFKPSALENRRLRWVKNAWCIHNLVGHPLMQVLALMGMYKTAMRVHDMTIPKPLGRKDIR